MTVTDAYGWFRDRFLKSTDSESIHARPCMPPNEGLTFGVHRRTLASSGCVGTGLHDGNTQSRLRRYLLPAVSDNRFIVAMRAPIRSTRPSSPTSGAVESRNATHARCARTSVAAECAGILRRSFW